MKKIIIIVLILAFFGAPVEAGTSQVPSLFDVSTTGRGTLLEYKTIVALDEYAFDTYSPGIFTLQYGQFSAVNYSGLASVHLRCYQNVYPYIYIQFYALDGDRKYLLTEGASKFYDMTWVTASPVFSLGAMADILNYNTILRCRVVIEAVR